MGRLVRTTALRRFGELVDLDGDAANGVQPEATRTFFAADGMIDFELLPTAGGDVTKDWDYDAQGRVKSVEHFDDADTGVNANHEYDAGEVLLAGFAYGYFADGSRRSEVWTDAAGRVTTKGWAYDGLNRLVSESYDGFDGGGDALAYTDAFAFDLAGNRVSLEHDDRMAGGAGSAGPDATTSYDYDANGSDLGLADPLTGLSFNRTRWYDPAAGRFGRVDPWVGDTQRPQTLNKYAYVHANPISSTDPTGLAEFSMTSMLATGAIAGAVGALLLGAYSGAKSYAAGNAWHVVARDAALGAAIGGIAGVAFGVAGYAVVVGGGAWVSSSIFGLAPAEAWVGQWFVAWHLGLADVGLASAHLSYAIEEGDIIDKTFAWVHLALAFTGLFGSLHAPAYHGMPQRGLVLQDKSFIGSTISKQRQLRHLPGSAPLDRSVMHSESDARAVLDAFHAGTAKVLSYNPSQNAVTVKVPSVTGTWKAKNGTVQRESSVFMIEGKDTSKVYPKNPDLGKDF